MRDKQIPQAPALMLNPRSPSEINRRRFLYGTSATLGSLACTSTLLGNAVETQASLWSPQPPMFAAKAKTVIMLFMEGGPSHMDTFDPKPELDKLHRTESPLSEGFAAGKRFYVGSPFKFRKVGNAGIDMCDPWVHLAKPEIADELCLYRGCQAESLHHHQALLQMNTGSPSGDAPALGAWAVHGRGSENPNLPGFVVVPEHVAPQAGSANWSNDRLPAHCQGVVQTQATGSRTIDFDTETQATREAYGLNRQETQRFGRQCLIARRLVEEGVRFVQVFSGGWDSHDCLKRSHSSRITSVDQPIAALLKDLRQRGLLDETLVIWTGEFGRSPDTRLPTTPSHRDRASLGREDNINAMNMWFAGGGTRRGTIVGGTDELGERAVECVHPIRDVHATVLHLLGLDHRKRSPLREGSDERQPPSSPSPSKGEVIHELIA